MSVVMSDEAEPHAKVLAERNKYKESIAKLTGFLKPMKVPIWEYVSCKQLTPERCGGTVFAGEAGRS